MEKDCHKNICYLITYSFPQKLWPVVYLCVVNLYAHVVRRRQCTWKVSNREVLNSKFSFILKEKEKEEALRGETGLVWKVIFQIKIATFFLNILSNHLFILHILNCYSIFFLQKMQSKHELSILIGKKAFCIVFSKS